ncbi:class I SAM-dependent methyltransferase [Streptomyces roseolilacinus]|uniref:class I SAM-dependent methyltransferase n=1 Tax=Streptomyces roseolilacinus TaxID=66904 RepID=UPI00380D2B70
MTDGDASEARYGSVPPVVRAVYGPDDLGSVPVFRGGFINFGCWDGIPLDGPLTAEDRERSERQLYRRVLDALDDDGRLLPDGDGRLPDDGGRLPNSDGRLPNNDDVRLPDDGGGRQSDGDARLPDNRGVRPPDDAGGPGGRAVEVGCGLGVGCALALREYPYASVTGMDIHPDQLDRARRANAALLAASPERLRLVRGAAERMPFGAGEFDHLYSVEAAQHFSDLDAFARECARVLRPGGRMAMASFFVPGDEDRPDAARALAERLDSFASGLDAARPLGALTGALTAAGLVDVRAESIGASVWPGLDRYLEGIDLPVTWPRNFLGAYRDGLLDYYLITAARPA